MKRYAGFACTRRTTVNCNAEKVVQNLADQNVLRARVLKRKKKQIIYLLFYANSGKRCFWKLRKTFQKTSQNASHAVLTEMLQKCGKQRSLGVNLCFIRTNSMFSLWKILRPPLSDRYAKTTCREPVFIKFTVMQLHVFLRWYSTKVGNDIKNKKMRRNAQKLKWIVSDADARQRIMVLHEVIYTYWIKGNKKSILA